MTRSHDRIHGGAGHLDRPGAIDRGAALSAGQRKYVYTLEANSATNQLLAARDTAPSSQAFWEKVLIDVNRLDRTVTIEANTFFHMLMPVLLDTPGMEQAELRLRAAIGTVNWLTLSNQCDNALRLGETTLLLARAHNDKLLLRRVLNVSGLANYYLGLKLVAMNRFIEAWRLALELSDPFRACWMVAHVAMVIMHCGMFSQAMELWLKLSALIDRVPDEEGNGYFQRSLYANRLELCALSDARSDVVAGGRGSVGETTWFDLQGATMDVEIGCSVARYRIVSRDLVAARQLLDRCAANLNINSSPLPTSNYELTRGLLEAAEGHADIGLSRIHAATETIGANRPRLTDALWVMKQAYRFAGDEQRSELYASQLQANLASGAEGVAEQCQLFMRDFDSNVSAVRLL